MSASVLTSSPSSTLNIVAPPSSQLRLLESSQRSACKSSNDRRGDEYSEIGTSTKCIRPLSSGSTLDKFYEGMHCDDVDEKVDNKETIFVRGARENPIAISPSSSSFSPSALSKSRSITPLSPTKRRRKQSSQPPSPSRVSKLTLGTVKIEEEELIDSRRAACSKRLKGGSKRPLMDGEIDVTDEEDHATEHKSLKRHLSAFKLAALDAKKQVSPKKPAPSSMATEAREAKERSSNEVQGRYDVAAADFSSIEGPDSSSTSTASSSSSTSSSSKPLSMLARSRNPPKPIPIELPTTTIPLLRRMNRCPLCALDFQPDTLSNNETLIEDNKEKQQLIADTKSPCLQITTDDATFRPPKLPQRCLMKETEPKKKKAAPKPKKQKRVPKAKILTGPARHEHVQACARRKQQEQYSAWMKAKAKRCSRREHNAKLESDDEEDDEETIIMDTESVMLILASEKDRLERLDRVKEVERQQKRSVWDDVLGSQQVAITSGRGARSGKFATSTISSSQIAAGPSTSARKVSPTKQRRASPVKATTARGAGKRGGYGLASTTILPPGSTTQQVHQRCKELFGDSKDGEVDARLRGDGQDKKRDYRDRFDWTFAECDSLAFSGSHGSNSQSARACKRFKIAFERQRYGLGLGMERGGSNEEIECEARLSMGLRLADDIAARFTAVSKK